MNGPPKKIRNFFLRREDRELDDELRFHVERRAEELQREGISGSEARRRARVELGGTQQIREEVRALRTGETARTVLQDLRYGWRTLLARPAFTAAAVLTLALGIAATTTVFSAIQTLLLRPLPFRQPEQLVLVWGTNLKDGQPRDVVSGPNFLDLQRQNSTLQGLAAFHLSDMPARHDDGVGVVGEMEVTPEFFTVLGVRPMLGRAFEAADGLPGRNQVALLSYAFWQQRFGGDPNAVGKTLEPLGQPHTIVGVLPRGFQFFTSPEVVTPLVVSELEKQPRTNYHYWVVGRLKDGARREQAETELDGIMLKVASEFPALRNWETTVEPLQSTMTEPVQPALLVLLCAAGMLLLIGCTNVASLLLARGVDRRWEFSIRTALGASRGRLVRQLLLENALLALVAGAVGALAAGALVEALQVILPETVAIAGSAALVALPPIVMDAPVLLFAALLSALTVLLFGLTPVLSASRLAQPQEALRSAAGRSTADPGSRRTQSALVVAETALATVLLIGAGLMLRTVQHLLGADPGFRAQNAAAMMVGRVDELDDPARARLYLSVVESVRRVPGVLAAGLNDYILLQNEDDYEGLVPEEKPLVPESVTREEWRRLSPGYFETMGIPLLSGRDFTAADNAESPSVAIVNQAMARKYWPDENPVGKRILITHGKYRWTPEKTNHWTEIVGVAGDERTVGVDREAKPMLYVPYHRAPRPVMGLFVRTEGDPRALVSAIQRAVWSVDRTRPIYGTVLLEELVADSISVQRITFRIAAALAAAALALTAIGIFGVLSYSTARRTREFGIRAALGAQPRDLLAMVLRNGLWKVFGGVALGAAIAALAARAMASLLYGVAPTDALTFASVAALLALVALLACWLPARRAMRVDPAVILRYE